MPVAALALPLVPRRQTSCDASMSRPQPLLPYSDPSRSRGQELDYSLDVDGLITKCLGIRQGSGKTWKYARFKEEDVMALCSAAREMMLAQPVFLEIEAPVKIGGDLHGQFDDLLRVFDYGGLPPRSNYLFLGDYVDRGRNSLETISLLLALKLKFRDNVFLLRGNHESAIINRRYGFYEECKRRYSVKLWKSFCDVFNCFPVSALVDEKILCMHGGLSPDLSSFDQIRRISRPTDVPESGLMCDLLWADPDSAVIGWQDNEVRGISYAFGPHVVTDFLQRHNLDLICRGHEACEDGYEFFADRQLVTIFSASNYADFGNVAAIMEVDTNLRCSFHRFGSSPACKEARKKILSDSDAETRASDSDSHGSHDL